MINLTCKYWELIEHDFYEFPAKSYLKWRPHRYVFEGAEVLYDPDDDDDDEEDDDDSSDTSSSEGEDEPSLESSDVAVDNGPTTKDSMTEAAADDADSVGPTAKADLGKPVTFTTNNEGVNSNLTSGNGNQVTSEKH